MKGGIVISAKILKAFWIYPLEILQKNVPSLNFMFELKYITYVFNEVSNVFLKIKIIIAAENVAFGSIIHD